MRGSPKTNGFDIQGTTLRSSSSSSNPGGGFRSLSSDSRISLFCDANCDDTPLQMSSTDGVTAQVRKTYDDGTLLRYYRMNVKVLSLSSLDVSCHLLTNYFNQVSALKSAKSQVGEGHR